MHALREVPVVFSFLPTALVSLPTALAGNEIFLQPKSGIRENVGETLRIQGALRIQGTLIDSKINIIFRTTFKNKMGVRTVECISIRNIRKILQHICFNVGETLRIQGALRIQGTLIDSNINIIFRTTFKNKMGVRTVACINIKSIR